MAEKDIAEKILLDYEDVFADIVNVLVFKGEQRVNPNDLRTAKGLSAFKDDEGKSRWHERDVAKFWESAGVHIALVGIENQSTVDSLMPARVLAYDGASYKGQIARIKDKEDPLKKLYPVVTIVLHYGDRIWDSSKSLHEVLQPHMMPELKPFVNDYRPYVCNVAFLDENTISMFKSDFGKVAEFFVKCRLYGKAEITNHMSLRAIRHAQEVVDLLSAFTNIPKESFVSDGKGGIDVTTAIKGLQDYWIDVGVQKERERMSTERKRDIRKLLSAGADERLLLTVYSFDEIREAKDSNS